MPEVVQAPQLPLGSNATTWVDYLAQNGLPAAVGGPAVAAVFRLIGGAIDIPAAWLNQKAQRIHNRTNSEKLVSEAIASKAAIIAASNEDLAIRASNSFVAKELRYQENKEAIALKAIEHLKIDPTFSQDTSKNGESATPIEEDWMNYFEKHAENASSERMQELWAKVLAGEIRKTGSFSLRSLQFMATIDHHTARIIDHASQFLINNTIMKSNFFSDPKYSLTDMLHLETLGLLVGSTGKLAKIWDHKFEINGRNGIISAAGDKAIFVVTDQEAINFPGAQLTKLGEEIFQLTSKFDASIIDAAIETIRSAYPTFPIYIYEYNGFEVQFEPERLA